jgi:hypothetical protein
VLVPGLSGYAVSGGVVMPLVVVVPGAHPALDPAAGAQLVVPRGAGVAPGVVLVGVVDRVP